MEIDKELYDQTYMLMDNQINNKQELSEFKEWIEKHLDDDKSFRSVASATYSYKHDIEMSRLSNKVMGEKRGHSYELEAAKIYCHVMNDYVRSIRTI